MHFGARGHAVGPGVSGEKKQVLTRDRDERPTNYRGTSAAHTAGVPVRAGHLFFPTCPRWRTEEVTLFSAFCDSYLPRPLPFTLP